MCAGSFKVVPNWVPRLLIEAPSSPPPVEVPSNRGLPPACPQPKGNSEHLHRARATLQLSHTVPAAA